MPGSECRYSLPFVLGDIGNLLKLRGYEPGQLAKFW